MEHEFYSHSEHFCEPAADKENNDGILIRHTNEKRFTSTDFISLSLILFIFISLIANHAKLSPPLDIDHHYHMAVARQILEKGNIPYWDDWEYAPAGPRIFIPPRYI
jgi:hypothetical protein